MIPVRFEDDFLMVLDKPPGLVVTSSETQKEPSLEDILKSECKIDVERSGIVHRIDKDTSGLILVAKTSEVLEKLQAQFKNREVHKEYLALVHGFVEKAGRIDAPIVRNPANREKFVVWTKETGEAKGAVTEYQPLKKLQLPASKFAEVFGSFNKIQMRKLQRMNYGEFTLLRCRPLTGRTHQIRVHLKYLGFPIVADEKYGGRKIARLDRRFCPRQFLHAAKIEFTHPQTGEKLEFESQLPQDLEQVLGTLEEYAAI